MNDIGTIIAKNMKSLRKSRGLTQQSFARKIGVNASYISPLEKGSKKPSVSMLARVSKEFNVPVFSFFVDDVDGNDTLAERIRFLVTDRKEEEQEFLLKTLEDLVTVFDKLEKSKVYNN